jgi:hypothetical protein
MPVTEMTPATKKGQEFLTSLKKDSFVKPTIVRDSTPGIKTTIIDENNEMIECDSFVSFSPEAIDSFPGSYIAPLTFQRTLEGQIPQESLKFDEMVGNRFGTMGEPTYSYSSKQFNVTILHGATNDKAIQLARIAKEGFTPENRAYYQQAVADMIKPAIQDSSKRKGSLIIHDDCLASTVSVAGYIADLKEHNSTLLENGVDIIIDGPATAQGILFLQKFAEVNNIKISITASFLAFGLTEGNKKANGTREHANYITLPEELFGYLPVTAQKKYEEFSPHDKDRAVVGDMGNAGEGIPQEILDSMFQMGAGELDSTFCEWNDTRTDPHHPKNSGRKVELDKWDPSKRKTITYFPRGGYICYAYDKTFNAEQFMDANTLMIGATRLWSPKNGYGVAYGVKK